VPNWYDTPGLDEGPKLKRKMAGMWFVRADLILFVVAGDIRELKYQALVGTAGSEPIFGV